MLEEALTNQYSYREAFSEAFLLQNKFKIEYLQGDLVASPK